MNQEFLVMVESLAHPDYVPALCTHRPSLLPIEWSGEVFGDVVNRIRSVYNTKLIKSYHLEEGEVVTRFS